MAVEHGNAYDVDVDEGELRDALAQLERDAVVLRVPGALLMSARSMNEDTQLCDAFRAYDSSAGAMTPADKLATHLLREASHQPEVLGSGGALYDAMGTGQRAAKREKRERQNREREEFEEDRFVRVDTNQKKRKQRKTKDFASSLDDLF